jgi:predicted amidohydrolase YtcJ
MHVNACIVCYLFKIARCHMNIFWNCHIITMDEGIPDADYIVVDEGRIVETGRGEISKAYEGAKHIDLGGRIVIPGFWESHLHIASGLAP